MLISADILRKMTAECLGLINAQIDEVKRQAEDLRCKPTEIRDTSGNYVLIPLLLAKTQAISTLVQLNQPNKK